MKIAVFSDTHGSSRGMIKAVEEYMPDQVIHLGDGLRDTEVLEKHFPHIPVCRVAGNCDCDSSEPDYRVLRLGSLNAFITHGHRYAVRGGKIEVLLYAAQCNDCQIAMFGHTHRAGFEQIEGIFVLNPGTAGKAPNKTWAKLEIGADGEIRCDICNI